jgi:hypothetical protein
MMSHGKEGEGEVYPFQVFGKRSVKSCLILAMKIDAGSFMALSEFVHSITS